MAKYFLYLIFVFLSLTSFSYANSDEIKLQKEFGKDLTHAPFFLRFSFYKKFNKDWKQTDYPERKFFLMDYENDLVIAKAKEKAEARAEADREKERLHEKKEALRKENDRLKAQEAEDRAEEKADEERQKEFDSSVGEQKRELEQLQQASSQSNR